MEKEKEKKWAAGGYVFDDKAVYDRAVKEASAIAAMRKKYSITNGKTAYQIYKKAIQEDVFSTVVGYAFLSELRNIIVRTGTASEKDLMPIPIKGGGTQASGQSRVQGQAVGGAKETGSRYQRLYEAQCLLNKKLKWVVFILAVFVLSIVIIDLKSEYSVFTFFTNYKAKMEEELVDKYRGWEAELKARESALQGEEGAPNGEEGALNGEEGALNGEAEAPKAEEGESGQNQNGGNGIGAENTGS